MKAISVKQPWASLICTPRVDNPLLGIKDIENRTWSTKYRGPVLIHASGALSFNNLTLNLSHDQMDQLAEDPRFIPFDTRNDFYVRSAIIGHVDIVDCVTNHPSIWAEKVEMPAGTYMGEKPIYNWVLANPVMYDEPILNVKGKLSLWDFDKTFTKK